MAKKLFFCDIDYSSNLERFIYKNINKLKKHGYDVFVIDKDKEKTLDKADTIISYSYKLANSENSEKMIYDLKNALYKDNIEILRVAYFAMTNNIIVSALDSDTAFKNTFTYTSAKKCLTIGSAKAAAHSLFIYSRQDVVNTKELFDGEESVIDPHVPGAIYIEDQSIDQILAGVSSFAA
jgi:hypothetical protein